MKTHPLNKEDYNILYRYVDSAKMRCTLRALYPNRKDLIKARASLHNIKKYGPDMKHMFHVKAELEKIADALRSPSEMRVKQTGPWSESQVSNARRRIISSNQEIIDSMSSYDLAKMLVFKGVSIRELMQ